MEKLDTSNESIKNTDNKFIISVKLNNGETIYPAYISQNDIDFSKKLEDAKKLFSSRYRNNGIIEVVIDENILNSNEIPSWNKVSKEIFNNESNDKVGNLLRYLNDLGVSSWFIDLMRKDLLFEDNIKILKTYLDLSDFTENDKLQTLKALEIAIKAHEGQTQKRKKDKEGLDNIPYSNHPIQVAIMAIRDLKMNASEVQAALLHDVDEDTEIKISHLETDFYFDTIQMVKDCTKTPDETREEFMIRMKKLTGSSKIIKCLDRLHNLIRAFSIKDPTYIKRYLLETIEVYLPAFESMDELEPLRILFYDLLDELEKYLLKLDLIKE